MSQIILLALAGYFGYSYRAEILEFFDIVKSSTLKTKASILVFFGVITFLIYPELIPVGSAPVMIFLLLVTMGYQIYCIYKNGIKTGVKWPKGSNTIVVSVILVLLTPIGDIILNRDYNDRAGVLLAITGLVYLLLYVIEIYQNHYQDLLDSPRGL